MNLTAQLTALREGNRGLTRVEQARRCCDLAKRLEKAGEYEAAGEALSEFWPDRGRQPKLDDLDEPTKAIVLLRAGALSGWLGSKDQAAGSQETPKDLITKSIEIFDRLGQTTEAAEAHGDLALCYWREGSYDEARIHLGNALDLLGDDNADLRAVLLIRAGIIEERTQRLQDALRFYTEAAPLVERSRDHGLKGSFHFEQALVFRKLAAPEDRENYLDRALIEYAASRFHFEQARNERALARVENNLGYLFLTIGKYDEAHKHLDRARYFFMGLKDTGMIAQVDDTRARTLLAEGRVAEAERLAKYAVHVLEKGDERAALTEALTTHGIALARLGIYSSAKPALQRAIKTAEMAGDPEGAGRAKLSAIEEMSDQTPDAELAATFISAVELFRHSQDPAIQDRLMACARKLIGSLRTEPAEAEALEVTSWEGFSIKEAVRNTEKAIIKRALKEAGGSVSKAAYLLGFRHHQSLVSLINIRHRDLLSMRSAVRKRRRPLSLQPKRRRKSAGKRSSTIRILQIGDEEKVASLLGEMFSNEEAQVERFMEGALEKLAGKERYDLVLIDNDLSGLRGLELVLRARSLRHRRRTPIVMLSGEEIETEARHAGVNAFLRKPNDVPQLPATIARLLKIPLKNQLARGRAS